MANIKVLGDIFAITSSVKLEDLKRIKRFRPEALTTKDENGEPTFMVDVSRSGGFNADCVVFSCETQDEARLACVTADLPKVPEGKNVREFLADEVGGVLAKLNKLEATLPAVLDEINVEHETAMASIDVA